MPDALQKHLRGNDQSAVELSLIEAELGFNEGPEKEGIYKMSDSAGVLHFPSKERFAQHESALQSGAKLIGFAPPTGMTSTDVQAALGELKTSISTGGGGGLDGAGTGGKIAKWSDDDTLADSSALSESMSGATQRALHVTPAFTSGATAEMNALEIFSDLTNITPTTSASSIRIKVPTAVGTDGAGSFYGLYIEDVHGLAAPESPLESSYAIWVEGGDSRLARTLITGELAVDGEADFNERVFLGRDLSILGLAPEGTALQVSPNTFNGSAQTAIEVGAIFSAEATSDITGINLEMSTEEAAFTTPSLHGIHIADVSKGADHTIDTQYGLKIEDLASATANYSIHTGSGLVHFGDVVTVSNASQEPFKVFSNAGGNAAFAMGLHHSNTPASTQVGQAIDVDYYLQGFQSSTEVTRKAAKIRVGKETDFLTSTNSKSYMAFYTLTSHGSGPLQEAAERVRISSVGYLGVNQTNPKHHVDVNGSFGGKVIQTPGNLDLSLDPAHFIIVCTSTTSAQTITLPPASGAAGRMYLLTVSKPYDDGVTVNVVASGSDHIVTQINTLSATWDATGESANKTFLLFSDGTDRWYTMGI
jgi:hypothetical protein